MSERFNSLEWLENPSELDFPHDVFTTCREGAKSHENSANKATNRSASALDEVCDMAESAYDDFLQSMSEPDSPITPSFNKLMRMMFVLGTRAQILQSYTSGLPEIFDLAMSRMRSNSALDDINQDEKRYVATGIARKWAESFVNADKNDVLHTKDVVGLVMAAMEDHPDIFEIERKGRSSLPSFRTVRDHWLDDVIKANPYLSRRGRPRKK